MVVAECKYSNKKVGIDVLEGLKGKSKKMDTNLPIKHFCLFSKSGFTDELKGLESKSVVLVELVEYAFNIKRFLNYFKIK